MERERTEKGREMVGMVGGDSLQYQRRQWTPLQSSCLENPMDGDFHFHALKKEMATHSTVLAWRIPGMEEPGGLRLWGRTESDMTEAT